MNGWSGRKKRKKSLSKRKLARNGSTEKKVKVAATKAREDAYAQEAEAPRAVRKIQRVISAVQAELAGERQARAKAEARHATAAKTLAFMRRRIREGALIAAWKDAEKGAKRPRGEARRQEAFEQVSTRTHTHVPHNQTHTFLHTHTAPHLKRR
jgi:hypothetical protein